MVIFQTQAVCVYMISFSLSLFFRAKIWDSLSWWKLGWRYLVSSVFLVLWRNFAHLNHLLRIIWLENGRTSLQNRLFLFV